MAKDRRYAYLNGTEYKSFTSYRKMREWAEDPTHDGVYYVSTPSITFKYTRLIILNR